MYSSIVVWAFLRVPPYGLTYLGRNKWTLFLLVSSSGIVVAIQPRNVTSIFSAAHRILLGVLYCSCVLVFVILWHPWVCQTTGVCLRLVESFQFAKFVYFDRNYSPSQVEWVGKMLCAILLLIIFSNTDTVTDIWKPAKTETVSAQATFLNTILRPYVFSSNTHFQLHNAHFATQHLRVSPVSKIHHWRLHVCT